MAKLEDPCPFCKSEIKYYPSRLYRAERGYRVECYCTNLKCDLRGVRTLTDEEVQVLLSYSDQPKPAEPQ